MSERVTSKAAKSDICEDLTSLVCSDKPRPDGTGNNTKIFSYENKKYSDIDELTQKTAGQFSKILTDPDKSELRETVFKAMPFKRKECPTPQSLAKNKCATFFSYDLAEMVNTENLNSFYYGIDSERVKNNHEKNLREINKLVNTEDYQTILADHYSATQKMNVKPDQEEKIKNDLFPEIKKKLLSKIDSLNVDSATKDKMRQRINNAEFKGFECVDKPLSNFRRLSLQYLPKAFYEPNRAIEGKDQVRICRGISSFVESEFSLIYILAHELSHSIDPCMIKIKDKPKSNLKLDPETGQQVEVITTPAIKTVAELDSDYALPEVISCLRNPKSIAAENIVNFCKAREGQPAYQDNNCANMIQFPSHCNSETAPRDQIGESTSDFFATEVMHDLIKERHPELTSAQWKNGISNLLPTSDSCTNYVSKSFAVHPKQMQRFNQIVLAHPEIRKEIGCPARSENKIYCGSIFSFQPPAVIPSGSESDSQP